MVITELMNPEQWGILGISALVAAIGGWLIAHAQAEKKIARLREQKVRLQTRLEDQSLSMDEKIRSLESTRKQLESSFKSVAGDVLRTSSSEFLRLAEINFRNLHTQSSSELEKREKAVENLVRPIRETLDQTEQHIRSMEKERQAAYGALTRHLETMAISQQKLQDETGNLVKALRRPEVRGQWGELTLRRLAELSGMVRHCDFELQKSLETGDGTQRPDMIVHMPAGRQIIVDAKAPMDAYLCAVECDDETTRTAELRRHARNLRERVRELSSRGYWKSLCDSPDFVVLFIPGDQFLGAAMEVDAALMEDAMNDKVVLATPSSLVALLRAVAFGWRQETLAENAEKIRCVGIDLYERLGTFAEHLDKLGTCLNRGVESFNKAVGSFDSRVLPGARKFSEMGIEKKKDIPELEQVERLPRTVQSRMSATHDGG